MNSLRLLPCFTFGPSPCPGHYPRHWANTASADSCLFTTQVALHGAGQIPALSAFLGFVSPLQAKALSWKSRDIWVPVAPAGNFTGQESIPHQRQVSPDKNVNFHCTAAPFTVSPEPRALTCCADLSGDWTLYAVSVRLPVRCTQTGRLIALHSGFLHLPVGRQGPPPHGDALAFG